MSLIQEKGGVFKGMFKKTTKATKEGHPQVCSSLLALRLVLFLKKIFIFVCLLSTLWLISVIVYTEWWSYQLKTLYINQKWTWIYFDIDIYSRHMLLFWRDHTSGPALQTWMWVSERAGEPASQPVGQPATRQVPGCLFTWTVFSYILCQFLQQCNCDPCISFCALWKIFRRLG